MKIHRLGSLFFTVLLLGVLAACNTASTPVVEVANTAVPILATETATAIPTEMPMPARVVLFAPSDLPVNLVNDFQLRLAEMVDAAGLMLDVREAISESDIANDWKIVVLLKTPDNLEQLRSSFPAVQFVQFTDDSALEGEGNVTVVYRSVLEQAFMAGYVTILSAPDFRAGGLLVWDDPVSGSQQQEAFENGAAYFCGRCASVYMPITLFPVTTSLPSSSTSAAWLEAFMGLNNEYIVYTTYVDSYGEDMALLNDLSAMNVVLVGSETPQDRNSVRWAATVKSDPFVALESVWGDLLAGMGGHTVKAGVNVVDVNEEYLTSGRMQRVEETMALLMDGAILPISPEYP